MKSKPEPILNANHPVFQELHAGCVEKYFGGKAVYEQGKTLAAAFERKRKKCTWVSLSACGTLLLATVAISTFWGPIIGGLGVILALYVGGATRGIMCATFFAEWGELTAPPSPEGRGFKRDWSKSPVAAMLAADALFEDFERIFEIASGFEAGYRVIEDFAPISLVEIGQGLAKIAAPAHALVEKIQADKLAGCATDENLAELEILKELLRLCALWGHRLLGVIWDEAEQRCRAASQKRGDKKTPQLIRLAPFIWPGFPRAEY